MTRIHYENDFNPNSAPTTAPVLPSPHHAASPYPGNTGNKRNKGHSKRQGLTPFCFSVFAFLAGVLWMGMLWRANMPMDWHGRNLWWILSGFVGIPLFCYLWCIIRSATKQDGRWHFSPKQDGEGVMRLALVLIVVVNVLFRLF